jgi:hypothetical protein
VRVDAVGYYAFARAPLTAHSFDFSHDYQYADAEPAQQREVPCPDYFEHKVGRIEGRKLATASAD